MEEIKLTLNTAPVGQKGLGLWLQSLRVGQIFRMTVADKAPSGVLLLKVGGHQITATADVPVHKGTVLTLEVTSPGPAVSLKIVNPSVQGAVPANPLDGYLKLLVPSQSRVAEPLLTLIDPVQNANILSLLGMTKDEIDRIYRILSKSDLLADPGSLKRAVQQSGLFLEPRLLSLLGGSGILPAGDLKAALMKLLSRVNQILSQSQRDRGTDPHRGVLLNLQEELEGALATITLKQLAAWQVDERGGCVWTFDIPIRVQDAVHTAFLRVERENTTSDEDQEQQDWKVLLSVNLPKLGAIDAELYMRGTRVSVVIYAEKIEIAKLMNRSRHQLQSGLESQGLNVSVLRCHQGSSGEGKLGGQWGECVDVEA